MKTEANFLLGGTFAFDLPEEMNPEPELRSVLWYEGAGRFVAYQPFGIVPGPVDNSQLRRGFSVRRNGALVSVFRALDEPSTRVAYWKLGRGYLSTFFDDRLACQGEAIDTDHGMREIIGGITIRMVRGRLPALSIASPVFQADPADPFNRESILFSARDMSPTGGGVSVDIWNEPSFVRPAVSSSRDEGNARSRVTNELSLSVEVQVRHCAPTTSRDMRKKIAASAVPVG